MLASLLCTLWWWRRCLFLSACASWTRTSMISIKAANIVKFPKFPRRPRPPLPTAAVGGQSSMPPQPPRLPPPHRGGRAKRKGAYVFFERIKSPSFHSILVLLFFRICDTATAQLFVEREKLMLPLPPPSLFSVGWENNPSRSLDGLRAGGVTPVVKDGAREESFVCLLLLQQQPTPFFPLSQCFMNAIKPLSRSCVLAPSPLYFFRKKRRLSRYTSQNPFPMCFRIQGRKTLTLV